MRPHLPATPPPPAVPAAGEAGRGREDEEAQHRGEEREEARLGGLGRVACRRAVDGLINVGSGCLDGHSDSFWSVRGRCVFRDTTVRSARRGRQPDHRATTTLRGRPRCLSQSRRPTVRRSPPRVSRHITWPSTGLVDRRGDTTAFRMPPLAPGHARHGRRDDAASVGRPRRPSPSLRVTDIGGVVESGSRTAEPTREPVGAETVLVLLCAIRHRTVCEQA